MAIEPVLIIPPGTVGFGIQLPVQSQSTIYVEDWELSSGPAEMARIARQADDSGFLYVAVCDHTVIPRRLASAMSTTWYDTVATLGWLAGITEHVRLLSHVYIAALRHPLRAAKEFATLDRLSGGRVIVGVGAGHVAEEFALMGRDFERRGALLDEAIDGISAGLVDEFPELDGPQWPASDVGAAPRAGAVSPPTHLGRRLVAPGVAPSRVPRRRLASANGQAVRSAGPDRRAPRVPPGPARWGPHRDRGTGRDPARRRADVGAAAGHGQRQCRFHRREFAGTDDDGGDAHSAPFPEPFGGGVLRPDGGLRTAGRPALARLI